MAPYHTNSDRSLVSDTTGPVEVAIESGSSPVGFSQHLKYAGVTPSTDTTSRPRPSMKSVNCRHTVSVVVFAAVLVFFPALSAADSESPQTTDGESSEAPASESSEADDSESPATASSELILGGTGYYESSSLDGEETVSVQERDESFDYRNANFLSARLFYLRPYTDNLYVGAGIDFIGNLRATLLDEDGEPDDPPEHYEFGPLLEGVAMAEWRIDIADDYTVGVGGQLGIGALFPRGDFADEIRDLQDQDVRTWRVPRPGWSIGAQTAFMWHLDERIALRTDLGVQWQNIFLFRTSQTVDDVEFEKRWTTGTLRGRLGVSVQITL